VDVTPSQPGHYVDETAMSNEEYQAIKDAVSKSHLDDANVSPRYYYSRHIDPDRVAEDKTEALIVGDAIHAAGLEPDRFESMFAATPEDAPKKPSTTQLKAAKPAPATVQAIKWWEEFKAEHQGKTILTKDQIITVRNCRDALHTHPKAKKLLRGVVESSFIATDPRTGALIKCRPDVWRPDAGMIVDLKSTLDAGPSAFEGAITNYRYHVQDPHYKDVVNTHFNGEACEYFIFIAVEKDPPNQVGIYWLHPQDIADGRLSAQENLDTILQYREAGADKEAWPDYGYED
jgi:hypothetical protein